MGASGLFGVAAARNCEELDAGAAAALPYPNDEPHVLYSPGVPVRPITTTTRALTPGISVS